VHNALLPRLTGPDSGRWFLVPLQVHNDRRCCTMRRPVAWRVHRQHDLFARAMHRPIAYW
jgi:hypothetical protein